MVDPDDVGKQTGPAQATPQDPVGPRRRRKRKSGILAHLPPVPEPVHVDVKGLSPKKAFYGWLILMSVILVAGVALNWFMTDGDWVPHDPQVANPDAALGDTPAQFLTTHPYDVLTASLFVGSVLLLSLSLVTPAPPGRRLGAYAGVALVSLGLGVLLLAIALAGAHLGAVSSGLAAFAQGPGVFIAGGVLVAAALAFLAVGASRSAIAARRHELRGFGWMTFAVHWALTGMYYYHTGGGDWVNMVFAYAAVFLLGYFAYQELVSRSLGEDNHSLRFTAAAVVLAATVWYAFLRVEALSQWIIETVAVHTVWMLEMGGAQMAINQEGQTGFMSAITYAGIDNPRTVIIILACTAIQSMMIFIAAAFAVKGPGLGRTKVFQGPKTQDPAKKAALFLLPSILVLALAYLLIGSARMSTVEHAASAVFVSVPVIALWGVYVSGAPLTLLQRRMLVIAVTVPIVYVLNLVRNTGIIIMWADVWLETRFAGVVSGYRDLFGYETTPDAAFSLAHNWIGKGGSLIALVLIAFVVFKILPEVLRALVGLLDLPRRRGPLERHSRFLMGSKDKTPAKPTTESVKATGARHQP